MIKIGMILIPVVVFAFVIHLDDKKKKAVWVAYGLFSVCYALRGQVGVDWESYLNYYNNINDPVWVARSGFEQGYLALCKVFHGLGFSYWGMVFFASLLISFLFYKAIDNHTENAGIGIFVGLFYFFYPSLEALRQAITLVVFFYSLRYVEEKPWAYFLVNCVALLFHRTAIIAFAFYFFYHYLWVRVASVGVVALFCIFKRLILRLLSIFPVLVEKIMWYTTDAVGFSHLFSFRMLETIALLVVFYFLRDKNKDEKLVVRLLELSVWTQGLLPIIMDGAYRFGYYSDFGIILACCCLYDRIKKTRARLTYLIVLTGYIIVRFLRLILANPQLFVW